MCHSNICYLFRTTKSHVEKNSPQNPSSLLDHRGFESVAVLAKMIWSDIAHWIFIGHVGFLERFLEPFLELGEFGIWFDFKKIVEAEIMNQ